MNLLNQFLVRASESTGVDSMVRVLRKMSVSNRARGQPPPHHNRDGPPSDTGPPGRRTRPYRCRDGPIRQKESNVIKYLTSMTKEVIIMKIYKPIRLLSLVFVGAAMWGLSLSAHALGTASGLTISNDTATINYTVNAAASAATVVAGSADFTVDNKVIVTVTEVGGTASVGVAGQVGVATTFTVANTGNTSQDYALTATELAAAIVVHGTADNTNFGAAFTYYTDDGDGIYNVADALVTHLDAVAADATITVHVVLTIPGGAVDTDYATISLEAETRDDDAAGTLGALTVKDDGAANTLATVQEVFADVAGTDDAANDGTHSDRDAYLVGAPNIGITKTRQVIWDPVLGALANNPKAIPGAYVRYVITVSNTGTAPAQLTTVTDTLNAALALDINYITTTAANPIVVGDYTSGANDAFEVNFTGADRTSFGGVGNPNTLYFTDNTADGIIIAGQVITATMTTILPVEDSYTVAGDFAAGDSVVIRFNVVLQ